MHLVETIPWERQIRHVRISNDQVIPMRLMLGAGIRRLSSIPFGAKTGTNNTEGVNINADIHQFGSIY